MATHPNDEIVRFVQQAKRVQAALGHFVGPDGAEANFISLGENCSSAWYLKQVGLRKAAFPFDWIFSSPAIVIDCIADGFARFLDKSLIGPKPDGRSAGHEYYHSNFFSHRNPLGGEEDYSYYQRCCDRFVQNIASQAPTCYLITLISEPDKRPGWANGFTCHFPMPTDQDHGKLGELADYLKTRNPNSKLLVVDHHTNGDRHAGVERLSEDVAFVRFDAGGRSTGVFYEDALDDFCFKLIMIGLYGDRR